MSGSTYDDCPVCGERFHETDLWTHWEHVTSALGGLKKSLGLRRIRFYAGGDAPSTSANQFLEIPYGSASD